MPSNRDIPGLDFGLGEEIDMLRETVRGFSAVSYTHLTLPTILRV